LIALRPRVTNHNSNLGYQTPCAARISLAVGVRALASEIVNYFLAIASDEERVCEGSLLKRKAHEKDIVRVVLREKNHRKR
jgi:hypothetical protein